MDGSRGYVVPFSELPNQFKHDSSSMHMWRTGKHTQRPLRADPYGWSLAMWVYVAEKTTSKHRCLFYKGPTQSGGHRTPSAWLLPEQMKVNSFYDIYITFCVSLLPYLVSLNIFYRTISVLIYLYLRLQFDYQLPNRWMQGQTRRRRFYQTLGNTSSSLFAIDQWKAAPSRSFQSGTLD